MLLLVVLKLQAAPGSGDFPFGEVLPANFILLDGSEMANGVGVSSKRGCSGPFHEASQDALLYRRVRIHFYQPHAKIRHSINPFLCCSAAVADKNVCRSLIILLAARTSAMVPKAADFLHAADSAETAHVF
jgi:hypothetical protein